MREALLAGKSSPHEIITNLFAHSPSFNGSSIEETFLSWFEKAKLAPSPQTASIPSIVHRIWLTNPADPYDPTEEFGDQLLEEIRCSYGEMWRHIFWTNDPTHLANLWAKLADSGANIEVWHYEDVWAIDAWRPLIGKLIADKKYVSASDALRICVLNSIGGIYCDMSFGFKTNIDPIIGFFDYAFVYAEQNFFQNSFLMMPKNNVVGSLLARLAGDPYLFPAYLLKHFRPWMELHLFAGPIITAIVLKFLKNERVGVLFPNKALVRTNSKRSWYATAGRESGLFGNALITTTPASFLDEERWLNRLGDILEIPIH
jgi:hypothetical protein